MDDEATRSSDDHDPRTDRTEADGSLPDDFAAPQKKTIGRYELRTVLGRGGFGTVYEGWDQLLKRLVAVKVLHKARGPEQLQAWMEEAQTVASLDHPFIVPVYDVGTEDGCAYMVSKLVSGGSLKQLMKSGPVDRVTAASIAASIAEALDAAHRQGIVHRDVKPANILMSESGQAMLADFGLALHESTFGVGARFVGTPSYMSPEQARHEGHRVDGRSDIYSLGVVLYELLVEVRPFRAVSVKEVLDCIRSVDVRPLRQIDRSVPRELERICLKTLAKRASDRHNTAGDLAEDLRRWVDESRGADGADGLESGHESHPSSGSLTLDNVSVVPRGLRPFDAADSDFFLHLLPGARDRDGVPESVRFWRQLIDSEDDQATFRVGVILGPSGSGKSSLVRAGIVPRLDGRVVVLRVEARAENFERHLLRRMISMFPELQEAEELSQAMTLLRTGHGLGKDQKFLLVIDQFEQWLNHAEISEDPELLVAMRQCDGANIQTVLLVRDDFMISVAEFMDALEEPLSQNRNFATVDLFGVEHTQSVLAAFGRAYGTIQDPPNSDQQRFLEAASEELSANGRVVPVHLALFADMIKDKPWTTAALRGSGGARGVGLSFLEERLSGTNAHPFFLNHAPAVRRVLQALLPADDSAIKPPARTLSQLSDTLKDVVSSDELERMLGLLDTEVRLVTPSGRGGDSGSSNRSGALRLENHRSGSADSNSRDPSSSRSDEMGIGSNASSPSGSQSSSREPAFQLTHDYLVPSIRSWLAMEEQRTRAGRARHRLRELAHAWEVRPEKRRLPSLGEWLSIRTRTRRTTWTDIERKMMSTAGRRFAIATSILVASTLLVLWAGNKVNDRIQGKSYAERVLDADVSEVESIVNEAAPYRREFESSLESASVEGAESRTRINRSLALSASSPREILTVVEDLDEIRVEDLRHVRSAGIEALEETKESVWKQFEETSGNRGRLLISCMLAPVTSEDLRWKELTPELVQSLIRLGSDELPYIMDLLEPIHGTLAGELRRRYESPNGTRNATERANLAEAIAIVSAERSPAFFVATAAAATPDELSKLWRRSETQQAKELKAEIRRSIEELRKRRTTASHLNGSLKDDPLPLEAGLAETLSKTGGQSNGRYVVSQAIPLNEFDSIAGQLSDAGFRPTCVRPYETPSETLIASIWSRGRGDYVLERSLSVDAARNRNLELEQQGFHLVDFAFRTKEPSGKIMALWVAPDQDSAQHSERERRSLIGVSLPVFRSTQRELGRGWRLERFAVDHGGSDETLCCALFLKDGSREISSVTMRVRSGFGDRTPGSVKSDLRFRWIPPGVADRTLANMQSATHQENAVRNAGSKADEEELRAIEFLSASNQLGLAEERLEKLRSKLGGTLRWRTYSAYLAARKRDLDRMQETVDWFKSTNRTVPSTYKIQLAALQEDAAAVKPLLDDAREKYSQRKLSALGYARALATVASMSDSSEASENAATELVSVLRDVAELGLNSDPPLMFSYCDFDVVRDRAAFKEMLHEKQLDQIFCYASMTEELAGARIYWSLNYSAHLARCETMLETRYEPISICAGSDPLGGETEFCSSWRRMEIDPKQDARLSRSIGNLALLMLLLGENDLYLAGLNGQYGRTVKNYIVLRCSALIPAEQVIDELRRTPIESIRKSLVKTLAGYLADDIAIGDRSYVVTQLQSWAANASDAGLRSSAISVLKTWKMDLADQASEQQNNTQRNWAVNAAGMTMIELDPPDTFLMGSPRWEYGRKENMDEYLHHARIGHRYAIAATEVTVEQFRRFWNDPKVQSFYGKRDFDFNASRAPSDDCPQIEVTWLHAVRFCQWLSELEGIDRGEWCYPGVWDPYDTKFELPKDYRLREGYRLPTQMEWEYAAHGGESSIPFYGNDQKLIQGFEWTSANADERSHPVGSLLPNDRGIWDMLGNVSEWTGEPRARLFLPRDGYIHEFPTGNKSLPSKEQEMTVRGGRYSFGVSSARAAERHYYEADDDTPTIGFRVVRTIRERD